MKKITTGLIYNKESYELSSEQKIVHTVIYDQYENSHLTLLISKVSEAINPDLPNNHIGEGHNIDTFLQHQKKVRFIINGGFNHYRKNFYDWKHQNFNIGDPVGIVKIREHYFEDFLSLENYGFLVQKDKGLPWDIITPKEYSKEYKYILGCTPLLIYDGKSIILNEHIMKPVDIGKINPPSILGHGMQNHPRTAVGMKNGNLYFFIVEGDDNQGGCTLYDLQQLGQMFKLDKLLNLDGGGSSQFRLIEHEKIIQNYIAPKDINRKLGHVLVIFDKTLK